MQIKRIRKEKQPIKVYIQLFKEEIFFLVLKS